MEYNDVYDIHRNLTGRTHLRGEPWEPGDYGMVACVWVIDGKGKLLMTRRAPEKSFSGTWENSGGAVKAGENSRQAVARELREETGIRADENEFEYIGCDRDSNTHYDFYILKNSTPLEKIVLLPGETDDVRWVTYAQVHEMIEKKEICRVIARQFLRQEQELLTRTDMSEETH